MFQAAITAEETRDAKELQDKRAKNWRKATATAADLPKAVDNMILGLILLSRSTCV